MKLNATKLTALSAMATAYLTSSDLDAQILYTDVDPDYEFDIYDDYTYAIDFNLDGATDAEISNFFDFDIGCPISGYCYGSTSQYLVVNALGVVTNSADPVLWGTDTMNYGDPISFSSSWDYDGWGRLYYVYSHWTSWYGDEGVSTYKHGQWMNAENKYIGVQFLIAGETQYGWIQLSVNGDPDELLQNMFIHGYAYEATPGMPIHAGDIGGCFPPEPIGTASITPVSAKAKWENVGSADYYELQYHVVGAATWNTKTINAPKTFKKIAGLTCETNYEWQVRAVCADGTPTGYSPLQYFTTASCRMENETTIDEENINIWSDGNIVNVVVDEEINSEMQFTMFDQLGNKIFESSIVDNENRYQLNIPAGIYIATLNTGNNMISKKIMIIQ